MSEIATEIGLQGHFRILGANFSHYPQVISSKIQEITNHFKIINWNDVFIIFSLPYLKFLILLSSVYIYVQNCVMHDSYQVVEIHQLQIYISTLKKPLWFLQSYPFITIYYYLTVKTKV